MSAAWVDVWRGPLVESRHRVSVAVSDASGRLRACAGDPGRVTFARSSVKPLQALPLVEDGGVERFGLSVEELALCCASHGGEPRHVELARSILEKIDADPGALACGPHPPMYAPAAAALEREGRTPTRLHNNCSGKHAGMLALARLHGWPLAGYQRPEHPVQQRVAAVVSQWAATPLEEIQTGVDGCGVVTFALPLSALAGAFARLAAASRRVPGGGNAEAAARVVGAMVAHPQLVAGTGRLDTLLMRATGGRVFCKVGAEGVYCAGVPGAELGIALKVEDGATRASGPMLIAVLRALGLLSEEELAALDEFVEPPVLNTRGEQVGRLRTGLELEPGDD